MADEVKTGVGAVSGQFRPRYERSRLVIITPFQLEKLERVIRKSIKSYVEVGKALKSIHDKKLYKFKHKSFGVYCDREWGFTRSAAYGYLYAVEVVESVLSNVQIPQTKAVALYPLKDVSKRQEIVDLRGFAKMTVREVSEEVRKRQLKPMKGKRAA